MSPFGELFWEKLKERRMRARTIAALSGVSPGYISSLRGRKAPSDGMVDRLAKALAATEEERLGLRAAARASTRHLEIPPRAASIGFQALHEFVERIVYLQPEQLQAIRLIIKLKTNEREEMPGPAKGLP
jgi:transcriptional regulator with XRE-family HTH domain